ncbi:hypothetical protein HHK36_021416 [Tetracentron sinense]|uniref:Uncharacterized protein n=1 Tax=Tetracentron sinense TaxID=13715 RepID=A0A834YT16_TETSI|nr:hypothetical protein HHK36_021416 [Tetracentron sinense]
MLAAIFDHPQTPLVNNLGMEYQTAASKHVLKRTRSLRRPDEVKRKRKKESSRSSDGLPMRCVIPRIADVSKENSEMWKLAEIKGPSHCRCLRLPDNLSILKEVHMSIPLLISYFTENQSLASVVVSRLIYTNSGVAILALASNGVHKLWKWQRNNENQAVKATASVPPQLWEPASGILMTNEMSNINPEDAVPCFALSNNDVYLISASGGKTSLFNMATFKVMDTFNPPPPAVTFIALHPQNNNIIAMGMEDSSIQVFNIKGDEAKINLRGHQKRITGLAFSLVLDVLVSSGADAQLFVWSVAQWKPKAPLPKAKTLVQITNAQALVSLGGTRVQFHKDQRQLLAIREQQITIYKAPKLNFLSEWIPRESSDLITDATYSCDCQLIYASLKDGSVSVLNATTLLLMCRISPTAYLPSNPSLMVYPLVFAAHPSEPHQFALGLTDGAVYILEPLESEGKWGNSFTGGRLPK